MIDIDEILAPLPLATYLSSYWDSEATVIRGHAEKFNGLISVREFLRCLRLYSQSELTVSVDRRRDAQSCSRARVSPGEAIAVLREGATICASQIDKACSNLNSLASRVKSSLGYCGEVHVNAYLSSPGEGFKPHFDAKSIITIQLAGQKQWRFHRFPAVPWPGGNANFVDGRIEYNDAIVQDWERTGQHVQQEWCDARLYPGDVLCLPPGAIHSAQSIGLSFSINLHFNPVDVGRLLGDLLSSLNAHRPEWRNVPPLLNGRGMHAGLRVETYRKLSAVASTAAEFLERWKTQPSELAELLALGEPAPTGSVVSIAMASDQQLISLNPCVSVIDASDSRNIVIGMRGVRISCPPVHSRIIETCMNVEEVTMDSLAAGLPPDTCVQEIVEELAREGVLIFSSI